MGGSLVKYWYYMYLRWGGGDFSLVYTFLSYQEVISIALPLIQGYNLTIISCILIL